VKHAFETSFFTVMSFGTLSSNFFLPWPKSLQWGMASSFSRLHNHTQLSTRHSVELLWSSDRPDAETSTWKYTRVGTLIVATISGTVLKRMPRSRSHKALTFTTHRHPCSRWDSNPKSLQENGRRPMA